MSKTEQRYRQQTDRQTDARGLKRDKARREREGGGERVAPNLGEPEKDGKGGLCG